MTDIRKNSIYNPVKANFGNRFAAFIMDVILYLVLFTGVLYLCGIISSLNEYQDILNAEYINIGYKVFDEVKQEYVFISENETNFEAVYNLYINSAIIKEYKPKVDMIVMNIPLISIVITSLILEFIVPLLLKNGQTVGMKCFKVALLSKTNIAIGLNQLFVRFIFGKVVLMKAIPYLCLFFAFFNPAGGLFGLVMLVAIYVGNIVLIFASKNKTNIADMLVSVFQVDSTQTVFYKTIKERDEAINQENKIISTQKKVY